MRGMRDFIDCVIERLFVCLRRFGESAQLPNELQRRRPDLVIRRRRTEVMKCFDGSAHKELLTTDYTDQHGFLSQQSIPWPAVALAEAAQPSTIFTSAVPHTEEDYP